MAHREREHSVASFAVSAEFVRPGRVGGLEQAVAYMVEGLALNLRNGEHLTVIGSDIEVPHMPSVESTAPPQSYANRFLQETISLRRLAPTVDSYFLPNYFTPPGKHPCRVVTMIPDLQYRHYPDNFSRQKRLWQMWAHRSTLKRADAVVVFSDFVRDDLVAFYGDAYATGIRTVPLPVVWDRFGEEPTVSPRARPYVLTVASHYRHKNLATLIRAFALVRRSLPDLELVCVGQTGEALLGVRQAESVEALVQACGLDGHVVVTGFVDDNTLGAWYRGAELFAFPSIFEGFGLPPVEALGFGLPVLTTRCASLPEVTRGLAEYMDDPFDAEEMAERIVEMANTGSTPAVDAVEALRAYYSPRERGAALIDVLRSV